MASLKSIRRLLFREKRVTFNLWEDGRRSTWIGYRSLTKHGNGSNFRGLNYSSITTFITWSRITRIPMLSRVRCEINHCKKIMFWLGSRRRNLRTRHCRIKHCTCRVKLKSKSSKWVPVPVESQCIVSWMRIEIGNHNYFRLWSLVLVGIYFNFYIWSE